MRSNKLVTSAFIVTFIAAQRPRRLTTGKIAAAVQEHPSRVRRLVALLADAGILETTRGALGGVGLARPAREITLLDVFNAVGSEQLIAMEIPDPFARWGGYCLVHPVLSRLFLSIEGDIREQLNTITISELYRRPAKVTETEPGSSR